MFELGTGDQAGLGVVGRLGGIVGVLEVAARSEVAGLDDDALLDTLEAVGAARRLLDATEAHLLAEVDHRGGTDTRHGLRTHTWVARTHGISPATARARVRVGRALTDRFDELDRALIDGRLSWEQVRVVVDAANARNTDTLEGIQPELVALARGATFRRYRDDVTALAALADPDGDDRTADPFANRLSISPLLDGTMALTATLAGDVAATVRHAIDARADELFRRHTEEQGRDPDAAIPDRATLGALALADLCRAGQAVPPGAAGARPPVPEVRLVVPAGDPLAPVTDLDGVRLADGTWRLLACDPHLRPVIVDALGTPLDVGRSRRLVTDDLRAAIVARDGGCVFPGCDAPVAWLEAHHRTHWSDGGPTDLANLDGLCRRHHRIIHRPGWTLARDPDDSFLVIESPTGERRWGQRHGRTPTSRPPPH